MTVTHTDGYPVQPAQVDALLIGMGERYDVTVTAADGVFALVASAEGKNALARALLSTAAGSPPAAEFRPPELEGRLGTVELSTAAPAVDLGSAEPDTRLAVELTGSMDTYDWSIDGKRFPEARPLTIRSGQRAALIFANSTPMWHPMHLHGHTFQVVKADGAPGARKDTVVVLPGQKLRVNVIADNPGIWMLHCHNTYHQEAGMMTSLDYSV